MGHRQWKGCTYVWAGDTWEMSIPPAQFCCEPKTAIKKKSVALAGVAQWIEHQPANQIVACSIPSQGTCLGCGPGPQ